MDNIKLEEKVKAEQRAYIKEWRSKNKDKVKKYNENYWLKKALRSLQAEGKK